MLRKLIGLGPNLTKSQSGAAALEFALIAPILVVMITGMVDGSLWVLSRMSVERSARAGAEYAAGRDFNADDIAAAVTSSTTTPPARLSAVLADPAPSQWCGCPSSVEIAVAACGSTCASGLRAGTYVTANAAATHTFLLNWPGYGANASITASTTIRID